ncbi:MAG: helix-turn-helix domain-containing protein [Tannerellaceae bacterium]
MGLFYKDEHASCLHYMSDRELDFLLRRFPEETSLEFERTSSNVILFVLEGELDIAYNEFLLRKVKKMEMILIPKSSHVYGTAYCNTKVIAFKFAEISHLCNKYSLQNLASQTGNIGYEFKALSIKSSIQKFLDLLSQCLDDGLNCLYYHELKADEILLLYRAYYSKEELADFFYPILGLSIDFRSQVIANYRDARTVEELAMKIGYSTSKFKRKFTEEFDEPVYQWMQKQKAKHVKYKLSFEDVDFTAIIDEFGFSSPAHFSRFCKAQFGATPSEYRKQLLGEISNP